MTAFLGGQLDLTSAGGYLDAELFTFMLPLLLLVYAIGAGSRAIAGEEESGTLDLLLAHPLSRRRLLAEKLGAMAVEVGVIAAVLAAVVVVAAQLVSMDVSVGRIVAGVLAITLLALAHGGVALLVGAATGRRAAAIGVATAVAVAGYLFSGLGDLVGALEGWRSISPFAHAASPIRSGLGVGDAVLLAALAVGAPALAWPLFERRDLAT